MRWWLVRQATDLEQSIIQFVTLLDIEQRTRGIEIYYRLHSEYIEMF